MALRASILAVGSLAFAASVAMAGPSAFRPGAPTAPKANRALGHNFTIGSGNVAVIEPKVSHPDEKPCVGSVFAAIDHALTTPV